MAPRPISSFYVNLLITCWHIQRLIPCSYLLTSGGFCKHIPPTGWAKTWLYKGRYWPFVLLLWSFAYVCRSVVGWYDYLFLLLAHVIWQRGNMLIVFIGDIIVIKLPACIIPVVRLILGLFIIHVAVTILAVFCLLFLW